jgi:TolB-like protein
LPFTNMSGDPARDYFADGMTEDIITELSHFRWLFVIARNSTFTYKGRAVDIKQVGRELGVRYVLEGGVRQASDRIRITAQLIDAVTAPTARASGTTASPACLLLARLRRPTADSGHMETYPECLK